MKFFVEVLPVLAFVLAYFFYPDLSAEQTQAINQVSHLELTAGIAADRIYFATAVLMISMLLQCAVLWGLGHLTPTHLAALVIVLIAGGLTVGLKNPVFIKWKPTVLYWGLAVVFAGSYYIGTRVLVQRMLSAAIVLADERVWRRLNGIWVAFFVVCGALNLYVAYSYPEEIWVQFKLYVLALGLPLVFLLLQGLYLGPHLKAKGH